MKGPWPGMIITGVGLFLIMVISTAVFKINAGEATCLSIAGLFVGLLSAAVTDVTKY